MTDVPGYPDRDAVLPGASRPLARAIADTDGRLDDVDTDLVRRVRSDAEAPAGYLPYLAWERSVDVWDPAWPEEVRRRVIAAAPLVARYKGTPYAVRTALDALYAAVAIREWWETVPRGAPYTFTVTAYAEARFGADRPLLTDALEIQLYAAARAAKPLARAIDFRVGVGLRADLGLAAAAAALLADSRVAEAGPATAFAHDLGVAAVGTAIVFDPRAAEAGPATAFGRTFGLAAAGAAILLLSIDAEAA